LFFFLASHKLYTDCTSYPLQGVLLFFSQAAGPIFDRNENWFPNQNARLGFEVNASGTIFQGL
jgi:hypothetical protein